MYDLCLIGERELVAGFKLVGINDTFIATPENGTSLLKQLFNSKKYNVIMVSQSFEKYLNSDEINLYRGSMDPLVIFIPLPFNFALFFIFLAIIPYFSILFSCHLKFLFSL